MPPKPQTKPSIPKLSEAARHFVIPEGIVTTEWPSVRDTCRGLQIEFDPWQAGAAQAILGKHSDGLYAADEIVISIPRQVGKTFLIGALVFALCIKRPGLLCLWTAHHYPTANETFESLRALARRPVMKPHVRRASSPSGNGVIEFHNGSRVLFGARERGFGRGIPKIGIIVFDEAQILGQNAIDDMIPATNQAENPLIFYIGTPPKPSDPSEVFASLRREAIGGETSGTLYLEFSADEDADPGDRDQWAKANPSYPWRTPARSMLRLKKNLGPVSFLREGLGVWDDDGRVGLFAPGAWMALPIADEPPPEVLGVAADADQTTLSLGAYGDRHVGAVRQMPYYLRQDFCAEVQRITEEYGISVAIQEKGPAGPLIEDLEALGVIVIRLSFEDVVQAAADMRDAVDGRRLTTRRYPALDAAVDEAQWRKVSARRVIDNLKTDAAMLEAVTYARWAAALVGPMIFT